MVVSKIARGHARLLVGRSWNVALLPSSVYDTIQCIGGEVEQKSHPRMCFSSSNTRSRGGEENSTSKKSVVSPSSSCPSSAVYEYQGPFSAAVTKVKKLSLFSCACAVGAGPVMLLLDGGATSATATMGLAGTLSAFGITTTGLLHWFTHPYVHKLSVRGDRTLKIETLNFFARPVVDIVPLDNVEGGAENSMHPLSTFMAHKKVFYIDRDFFADKDVLDILDPPGEETEVDGQGNSGGEPLLEKSK